MPTPTYVPLATITLTATDSEIIFSSIPATYRDLILVVSAISDSTTIFNGFMKFNSDEGSNYSNVQMLGNGSAAQSFSGTDNVLAFTIAASGQRGVTMIQIMDYSATDKHKTCLLRESNASDTVRARAGRWANTSAINRVAITGNTSFGQNFVAGSTFSLYGVN